VATGLTPRSIAVSPDGQNVYVTNSDGTISVYDAAMDGSLTLNSTPSVSPSTPRGVTVSRDGNSVYVADFGSHLTPGGILQFDVAPNGALTPKAVPAVPAGNSPVEVTASFDGKSLYASNFNGGDVSQYDISAADGALSKKGHPTVLAGMTPTQIALTPPEAPKKAPDVLRCRGEEATIIGTNGRDKLKGTAGIDVIVGLSGRDSISGLEGDDVICGNKGKDKLRGGNGDDFVSGQTGPDRVKGGNGDDDLFGDRSFDRGSGGPAGKAKPSGWRDALNGGKGLDHCDGGGKIDTAVNCEAERAIP
jgi:hypothetical protein